jgi:hypothetical protein
MGDWSPLEDEILLEGMLNVVVRRRDGRPRLGQRVGIRGCGFR